jgi:RNA polymerase subunit RPABC4/transcription elongation factor Spt4
LFVYLEHTTEVLHIIKIIGRNEVNIMGLLNAYNEWKNSRYQRHLTAMKDQDKCPDCFGRGYYIYPANEFVYNVNPHDCPGCNGTGTYTEWENLK